MADKKIPKRSDVPESSTWNLKDMFESDEAWGEEYAQLKTLPEKISAYAGKLGENAETLLAYFRLEDEVSVRLEKFFSYASCKSDEDTALGQYQDMKSKATACYVAIAGAGAFAAPEIMAIPEETLEAFHKACPELEEYRRALYRIRRRAAHILSTVQMPSGMPVATVAIDGAFNAALLSIQILAVSDEALAQRLTDARAEGTRKVLEKNAAVEAKYNF